MHCLPRPTLRLVLGCAMLVWTVGVRQGLAAGLPNDLLVMADEVVPVSVDRPEAKDQEPNFTPVPEPSTLAVAAGALLVGVLVWPRFRRTA